VIVFDDGGYLLPVAPATPSTSTAPAAVPVAA
jgi:hypothetical protein